MSFTNDQIKKIWEKATRVVGFDPAVWRKDQCTAWINQSQYGNRQSNYGWEIDHIDPNGGDEDSNLRPLQWENNAVRQDGRLTCPIWSHGNQNTRN